MKLKNEYLIDTYDAYFSVLKRENKLLLLHRFGADGKKFKTKIRVYSNKEYDESIVLNDSCLSHNFSIPPGYDFAIAGLDYSVLKNSDYNGNLYILHPSENFNSWKVIRKLNITSDMENFIKAENAPRIVGNFDSMTSLLFKNSQYFLYSRANVKLGVRHLQYFTSKDLTKWEAKGKILLDTGMKNTECYYSPYFFKHPRRELYIGWLTYLDMTNRYHCLKIFTSIDCIHWKYQNSFFDDKQCYFTRRKPPNLVKNLKPYYFPVYGHWEEDDEFNFMIQYNYLGLEKESDTKVVHYSMGYGELDELCNL